MAFLVEGVKVGLILCFLLGPIFFTLIQTGVEQGFRAGAMVGLGIWLGDIIYMLTAFWGVALIKKLVEWEYFYQVFGGIGSLILVIFGLVPLINRPKNLSFESNTTNRTSSYLSLFAKGFLINGFNPFTIFFWLGVMTTYVISQSLSNQNAVWFFIGIIGIVVLTDLVKVLLAKRIRSVLKPIHLVRIRVITGIILILFGIGLVLKVFFNLSIPIHI